MLILAGTARHVNTSSHPLLSSEDTEKCGFHSNASVKPSLVVTRRKQHTKQKAAEDAASVVLSLFGKKDFKFSVIKEEMATVTKWEIEQLVPKDG